MLLFLLNLKEAGRRAGFFNFSVTPKKIKRHPMVKIIFKKTYAQITVLFTGEVKDIFYIATISAP